MTKITDVLADVWPDSMGQWTADQADAARTMKQAILRKLAGRTVVELPEPANGYHYGRAWRRTDAEPPDDVTLLRNPAHDGSFDADLPGPYVKRAPSGDWWFVERPDEETDPEGWPWSGLYSNGEDGVIWFEVVADSGGSSAVSGVTSDG